jgi:hypothetical protein
VPRTLMISTNWSIPLSPGNKGCPSISSAMTQPVDQISREVQSVRQPSLTVRIKRDKRLRTDIGCVICGAKDEFGGTIVPRADVTDIRFSRDENLGRSKITKFEHTGSRI